MALDSWPMVLRFMNWIRRAMVLNNYNPVIEREYSIRKKYLFNFLKYLIIDLLDASIAIYVHKYS